MAMLWERLRSGPAVRRIFLPASLRGPGQSTLPLPLQPSRPDTCPVVTGLAEGIRSFLSGRDVSFDLSLLRLDLCPPFQRRVLLAEYGIPRGSVSTYGRIARHLGRPGAARAVGTALAKNPFPIAIPCHRALRADLTLGGYQGGLAMKRRLLEMEGVEFDGSKRAVKYTIYY